MVYTCRHEGFYSGWWCSVKAHFLKQKGSHIFLCHQKSSDQTGVCGNDVFLFFFLHGSESKLCESGSTPVCVYMRDEVRRITFSILVCPRWFSRDDSGFYCNRTCVSVGQWCRSAEEDQPEVAGFDWRKRHCQVGRGAPLERPARLSGPCWGMSLCHCSKQTLRTSYQCLFISCSLLSAGLVLLN